MALAPFCKKCDSKHWRFQDCLTKAIPEPKVEAAPETVAPKQNASKGLKFPKLGTEFRSQFGVPFTRFGTKNRFSQEGFNK